MDLSAETVEQRRAELPEFTPQIKDGYLNRYAKLVRNAGTGAVLG